MKISKRTALGAAAVAALAFTVPSFATPGHGTGGTGDGVHCTDMQGNQMDGTISWSPTTIWPPNHKFQTITVNYTDNDNDGDHIKVSAPVATHNQMTNGIEDVGAGNTPDDFRPGAEGSADDPGTATTYPQVRAERSGKDGDRIYSITVNCTDENGGNSAAGPEQQTQTGTATITVTVPHDMGHRA